MIDPVFNVLFLCTGNSAHGGKHHSHAGSGVIQCLLSGEPSAGRDQPIRAKNHHRLQLSDRGFEVQNLERVCNTQCAEIGFRLHALRRRGGRDLSRMAGTTNDKHIGASKTLQRSQARISRRSARSPWHLVTCGTGSRCSLLCQLRISTICRSPRAYAKSARWKARPTRGKQIDL